MSKNVNDVITYFENLYKNKAVYLWGANGQIITKELHDNLYKTYGSSTYNKTYYDNKLKEGQGKIGADCSGVFYTMSGFDATAQDYYNKCSTKGVIASINRNKPCLVFKGKSASSINHIGFYLGNGYVIEMKSSKENCVKDKLEGKGWKWFGIPTWINYSSTISNAIPTTIIKAIDVSSYQGNINWNLVKSAGVDNTILKIIRKDLNPDTKFEQNWNNCKSANVNVLGVYNYSYATTVEKAITDAKKVLSILNGRKCTVWLDVEDNCQKGLGQKLIDIINAYRDVIVSSGYNFGVYTGMSFYNSYLKSYKSKIKCNNWWVARYYTGHNEMDISINPNEKYNPKDSTGLNIYGWQYTSSGRINGVNGNVDINVVYGNIKTDTIPNIKPTNSSEETALCVMGKITANKLNIRESSNTNSRIVGMYSKNQLIHLSAKTSNGWYKTDVGYISGKYVENALGQVVNCNKLNMRKEPNSSTNNVIRILNVGEVLTLMDNCNNWYKVIDVNNNVGYVSSKYIKIL